MRHIDFDDSIFQPKVFVHPQRYLRCDEAFKQLQKDYRALSITLGAEVQRYAEDNGDISIQYKSENTSSTLKLKLVLCAGALNNPIIHNSIVVDHNVRAMFNGSPHG